MRFNAKLNRLKGINASSLRQVFDYNYFLAKVIHATVAAFRPQSICRINIVLLNRLERGTEELGDEFRVLLRVISKIIIVSL